MRETLTKVLEDLREFGLRLFGRDREPTDKQLADRVQAMEEVLEMVRQPGWETYRQHCRTVIAEMKDEVMALPVEQFAGGAGVEWKGRVLGAQAMLNQIRVIIDVGLRAEAKLKERSRVAPASRPTVARR